MGWFSKEEYIKVVREKGKKPKLVRTGDVDVSSKNNTSKLWDKAKELERKHHNEKVNRRRKKLKKVGKRLKKVGNYLDNTQLADQARRKNKNTKRYGFEDKNDWF